MYVVCYMKITRTLRGRLVFFFVFLVLYRSSSAFTSLVFHSDYVQTLGLPSVGGPPNV